MNHALTCLKLGNNCIGASGTAAIVDALRVWPAVRVPGGATVQCLQVNRTLTSLDLSRNKLDVKCAAVISDSLKVTLYVCVYACVRVCVCVRE